MLSVKEVEDGNGNGIFAREDLVSQVTEWIRQRIFSGEFPTGGNLSSEGKLAAQLGVSRNVMRESMRNLRMQGLIEMSQGRRPRVKTEDSVALAQTLETLLRGSRMSLLHLAQARLVLEPGIAGVAARAARTESVKEMADLVDQLQAATTIEDRVKIDFQFHRLLAQATGNPMLVSVVDLLSAPLRSFQKENYGHSDPSHAVREHRSIVDAVSRHDAEAARAAMLLHLQSGFSDLEGSINCRTDSFAP